MTTQAEPREWKKRPLLLSEVPLPEGGGFLHDVLLDDVKRKALIDHKARVEQVIRESIAHNERAKQSVQHQDLVLAISARDMGWWIDHFVYCHEPRESDDRLMVLYPYQQNKIVEPYCLMRDTPSPQRVTQMKAKSRDMGLTWVEIACRVHSFLFKENWSILLGGLTQLLVDDGGKRASHESLLGKFRYILRHLPKWMQDRLLGPVWEKDEYTKKLKQHNPLKPNNIVDGKQIGSDLFGRSGRYSEAFIDEFAYALKVKKAEKAIKQTTTRLCGVSTPKGRGTLFDQLMFTSELNVTRFWIWWGEHPEKNLLWYNLQREDMDEADIASELDINFNDSVGDRVLPEVTTATHFIVRTDKPVDPVEPEGLWHPSLSTSVVIDFGISHPMAAIWSQWSPRAMPPWGAITDFCQTQGRSVDWIVPFIIGEIPPGTWRGDPWPHIYTEVELQMIARHRRWGITADVYGDWQGSNLNLVTGAHSAFDELGKYGISVTAVKILDDFGAITSARQLMRHMRVDKRLLTQRNGDVRWCPTFAEVLMQWRFRQPHDGETQNSLRPVHDRYCHGGDCLKMLAATIDIPTEDAVMSSVAGKIIAKRGSDLVRSHYSPRY